MTVDPDANGPAGRAAAPASALQRACARLDCWLGVATEWPAAALVVAEITVLFTGVVFRYGIDRPLVWTDELASLLFLWLCMLGAVIAQRRGAHMRLTAVAMRLPMVWRNRLEALAAVIAALFMLQIIAPAADYAIDQIPITMPALGINGFWRTSAILVGAVLMLVTALLQMIRQATPRDLAFCLPGILAVLIPVLVLAGTPIAFAFGISTITYLQFMTTLPMSIVVSRMDEGMASIVLLAIPLFVFLGLLIEMTGLAALLVNLMASLVGHLRGGLSYVLVCSMYLVSGISGSKAADMAAIAPVLLPEMERRGQPPGEMIGLLSASAAMGETIPPSIVLITVGSVTGVSIAGLFSGGILPALVGAIGLAVVIFFRARGAGASRAERATGRQIGRAFLAALPALALPVLIRWAVVSGVATATEVSTIGVVYTLLIALLINRRLDLVRMGPLLVDTAVLTGAVLLILGTATAMGWALTQSRFSAQLVAAMAGVPGGAAGFLALSVVVFAILGSVLEGIPAIVLFGPLLFPVAHALGINLVHYAIVAVLSMSLGLFTPPFGIGFYQACAIGRVAPDKAVHACWPYMAALLIATMIVAAVPWLALPGF